MTSVQYSLQWQMYCTPCINWSDTASPWEWQVYIYSWQWATGVLLTKRDRCTVLLTINWLDTANPREKQEWQYSLQSNDKTQQGPMGVTGVQFLQWVTGVQFSLQWVPGVQHSLQWVPGWLHSLQWVTGVQFSLQWVPGVQHSLQWQVYSLQSNDQTQQTQGSDRSTASTDRVPTGFCFKTRPPPSPHSFFQSEAKTEKRSQSVTVRGLTIVQRSWWWAMTMSPSCQTRSVATQPAPEAPETSIPAHRPIVNTAFLATSLWFNPFPALITSYLHGEGFLSCYTASHLNSECLCMLWRSQVLETGHPA